jgi:hypothetical protein
MTIYAVNGKEPVAAWIPSLDTAGNGTTTLTDLVGSNNGTLTNMDAATDWVADTDSGGVRALACDGVNDFINCGTNSIFNLPGNMGFSCWVKPTRVTGNDQFLCERRTGGGGDLAYSVYITTGKLAMFRFDGATRQIISAASVITNVWNHLVFSTDNSGSYLGINGVWETFARQPSNSSPTGTLYLGKSTANSRWLAALLDDVRIFNIGLDASDVAYLYNSGTGRGIITATGNPVGNLQNNLQSMRLGL